MQPDGALCSCNERGRVVLIQCLGNEQGSPELPSLLKLPQVHGVYPGRGELGDGAAPGCRILVVWVLGQQQGWSQFCLGTLGSLLMPQARQRGGDPQYQRMGGKSCSAWGENFLNSFKHPKIAALDLGYRSHSKQDVRLADWGGLMGLTGVGGVLPLCAERGNK